MSYLHTAIQNVGLTQFVVSFICLLLFTLPSLVILHYRNTPLNNLGKVVQVPVVLLIAGHALFTQGARNHQMIINVLIAALLWACGWWLLAEIVLINAFICLPIYHHVISLTLQSPLVLDIRVQGLDR